MYKPSEINTLNKFAGYLRCSPEDLPFLETKESSDVNPVIAELKIPKKNRKLGCRTVYKVRSQTLINVLKVIKFHLNNLYAPLDCVNGFVKGRSIVNNAKVHLNQQIVLNLDIENFFEKILISDVVSAFLCLGFSSEYATKLSKIVTYNDVLVAGFPTSPIIANMICHNLDLSLIKLSKENGVNYSRYADDLSFSGERVEIINQIKNLITEHGFNLNNDKTKIYKRGKSQYVTGLSVADSKYPRVPKKIKRALRAELYYILKFGLESHITHNSNKNNGYTSTQLSSACHMKAARIIGWIHFINSIEPQFAKECTDQIGRMTTELELFYFDNAIKHIENRSDDPKGNEAFAAFLQESFSKEK